MANNEEPGQDAEKITVYVERISALQTTIRDLNAEVARLRQDARINGVDLEALNFVSNMRSRFPADGGGQILDRIIDYSDSTGVEFQRNPVRVVEAEGPAGPVPDAADAAEAGSGYVIEDEEKQSGLAGQLITGVLMTVLLLWLVH